MGHHHGAAGGLSVAAQLVGNDIDINGSRHGPHNGQCHHLLGAQTRRNGHGAPDGRHDQQLDAGHPQQQREILPDGVQLDAGAHHQKGHGAGCHLEIAQALGRHIGQLDLEIGEGQARQDGQHHGVFQHAQQDLAQTDTASPLLDGHQNDALDVVQRQHQGQDHRRADHGVAVVDILQQGHAQVGEVAPEARMGKGALLALVPAQEVGAQPGQDKLHHHARHSHLHIPQVKGSGQVRLTDIHEQFGRQHHVVDQIGGPGHIVVGKKPLAGQHIAQPQQNEQRQAHIEAEEQIFKQTDRPLFSEVLTSE